MRISDWSSDVCSSDLVAAHPGYSATNDDIGNFFMRLETRLFEQKPAIGALPALYAATASGVRGGDYIWTSGFTEVGGVTTSVEASEAAREEDQGHSRGADTGGGRRGTRSGGKERIWGEGE